MSQHKVKCAIRHIMALPGEKQDVAGHMARNSKEHDNAWYSKHKVNSNVHQGTQQGAKQRCSKAQSKS